MSGVFNLDFYNKSKSLYFRSKYFLRIIFFALFFPVFYSYVSAQEYGSLSFFKKNALPDSLFMDTCRYFHSEVLQKKFLFPLSHYANTNISETEELILSKEPAKTGFSEKLGIKILSIIARKTLRYYCRANDDKKMRVFQELPGYYVCSEMYGLNTICTDEKVFCTDTYIENALKYNIYVSGTFDFRVDEQASMFPDYEAYVVAALMHNFASGTGPEHFVFPENGIISSLFLKSGILKRTLRRYKKHKTEMKELSFYNIKDFLFGFLRKGSFFNIEGFTGSASISIIPCEEGIEVKIFNISSLTSGAAHKEIFGYFLWPECFVRQANIPTECGIVEKVLPYANISQTFQLFISYDALKMR